MKNPIRTWCNWYGRNLVEISTEPAGKAIMHYGKVFAKNAAVSFVVSAVVCGGIVVGYIIREKIEEAKED